MINQENANPHTIETDDTINIRAEIEKYIIYWKWFVLGVSVSVFVAFLYLRYSTPLYSTSAVILIKDDKKSGGMADQMMIFDDLGLGGSNKNVDNEIEIIKSRKIIGDVIKKLDFTISYFSTGGIKETEIYPASSPIRIEFLKKDSLFYQIDTIFKISNISENGFDLLSQEDELQGTHQFNQLIPSKISDFKVVNQSKQGVEITEKSVMVTIHPINSLINSFKTVNISPVNKNASVLTLSINHAVKKKAEDFLNTLVDLYNEDAISDKNQVSKKTKEFIDNRIDKVGKSLSFINDSLKNFKIDNKLTNIEAESALILQTLTDNTKQIVATSIQLTMIESLGKELNDSNDDNFETLPTNLGLDDPTMASTIINYNTLVLNRNRLLRTATEINPSVLVLTGQIQELKSSLKKSLANTEKGLQLKIAELKSEERKIKAKISGVPLQELLYTDIKLQQEIIAGQFAYLLKKKEDADLSLAITVENAKIIDKAYGSSVPVSPKRNIIYLGALFLGVLIPFILVYIKDLLDTKIHTKKDIEDALSVPFLGDIPKSDVKEKIVIGGDARSSTAEAFRLIRTNLDFMLASSKSKSNIIFITSTTSGEGKSFISINTAVSLALSGKKVLLLGLDLRAPKVTEYLGIPDKKGVTNYITNEELTLDSLKFNVDGIKNLDFITSGAVPPNPAELLMTKRAENLFAIVKEEYDYVIVDTAPVNLVTDTLLIAKHADMFIYVARANYLDKRLLAIPQALYNEKRLPNMAMILNDTDPKRSYGYGYGGYGYGYVVEEKPWYKKIFNRS